MSHNSITRPIKVYLDTANWQDMASSSGSQLFLEFRSLVREGAAVPVFSTVLIAEVAKKNESLRQRIADAMMMTCGTNAILWIRSLRVLCRMEFNRAALLGSGRLDDRDVYLSDAPTSIDFWKVISRIEGSRQFTCYKRHAAKLSEALALSRRRRASSGSAPYTLQEKTSRVACWGNAVSDSGPLDIAGIYLSMPANAASIAYEEGYDRTQVRSEGSDAEDMYHLGAAAYCDVAFVDWRTHFRLSSGGFNRAGVMKNADLSGWIDRVCGS